MEETHYYPFGLVIAALSTKASEFGGKDNKYGYNGIEQNEDFDLNMYDAFYRNLDPQLGRFWQIDPKLESIEAWSPYSAMLDNPIRYADPLGDSIKPNVTTNYALTSNPQTLNDLGQTSYTTLNISDVSATNVNINVGVTISLTGAFQGTTSSTNIETQNPGLEKEVKAHEEGHKDQFMDAANLPITISVDIDGTPTTFTGTGDQVIVNATAAFNTSSTASGMSGQDKSNFIGANISIPTLQAMDSNIMAVYSDPNVEVDANNRAATNLGANTIQYSNGNTPIIFNGIIIK